MANIAPMKNFLAGLLKGAGPPKANGRPKKTSTIADLAPLPRGIQTRNPVKAKLPALPTIAGKM